MFLSLHLFSTDNITHITYVQQISSDIHNRQQYACSHWAEKHTTEYYSHDVCRNIQFDPGFAERTIG